MVVINKERLKANTVASMKIIGDGKSGSPKNQSGQLRARVGNCY